MRDSVTIAYLEDDQEQSEAVVRWLKPQGINCIVYVEPAALKEALDTMDFDAVMLDVEIRGEESGLALLHHIRLERSDQTPVLMMSANAFGQQALSCGADDFLEKPLNSKKLLNHIHRLLRPVAHQSTIENYPPFQVNAIQQRITLKGDLVDLSNDEYVLASTLFRHFGKVVSYDQLLAKRPGKLDRDAPRQLESDLQRLKRKMGLRGLDGWRLEPVYRHGMRLVNAEYDPS